MVIVGYFGGIDPAACLLRDGVIESYVEEERLIRYKHAPNIFPIRSIDYCLKHAGVGISDVDYIAYGWDVSTLHQRRHGRLLRSRQRQISARPGDPGVAKSSAQLVPRRQLPARLRHEVVRFFGTNEIPPIRFFPHHASHAATAYYMSPYEEALIVTIDGSGDSQSPPSGSAPATRWSSFTKWRFRTPSAGSTRRSRNSWASMPTTASTR